MKAVAKADIRPKRSWWKILLLAICVCVMMTVVFVGSVLVCYRLVENDARPFIYDDVNAIPENNVGLVLGTGKYLNNGRQNYYYKYRIDAAEALFKAGKIRKILLSGDNHSHGYNEPEDMRADLLARGIPDDAIVLDYAGFRTLDSVVRSKEIFGQKKITIISQEFHNARAVYLAHTHGIEAVAYNAKDVSARKWRWRNLGREGLARVKMFLDLLVGKQPKFLGEEEPIEE